MKGMIYLFNGKAVQLFICDTYWMKLSYNKITHNFGIIFHLIVTDMTF